MRTLHSLGEGRRGHNQSVAPALVSEHAVQLVSCWPVGAIKALRATPRACSCAEAVSPGGVHLRGTVLCRLRHAEGTRLAASAGIEVARTRRGSHRARRHSAAGVREPDLRPTAAVREGRRYSSVLHSDEPSATRAGEPFGGLRPQSPCFHLFCAGPTEPKASSRINITQCFNTSREHNIKQNSGAMQGIRPDEGNVALHREGQRRLTAWSSESQAPQRPAGPHPSPAALWL